MGLLSRYPLGDFSPHGVRELPFSLMLHPAIEGRVVVPRGLQNVVSIDELLEEFVVPRLIVTENGSSEEKSIRGSILSGKPTVSLGVVKNEVSGFPIVTYDGEVEDSGVLLGVLLTSSGVDDVSHDV
jgi:hypothetical protein